MLEPAYVGIALDNAGVDPERGIKMSGLFPELGCQFEISLFFIQKSVWPDRIREVKEFGVEIGSVELKSLFIETLGFGGIRFFLIDIGDVPNGVSVGKGVVLVAIHPGSFCITGTSHGELSLVTRLASQGYCLSGGSHGESSVHQLECWKGDQLREIGWRFGAVFWR